jgi:glycosyltransferase involved in cell wall biosynthesis
VPTISPSINSIDSSLSIIIPAFNEQDNVKELYIRTCSALKETGYTYEIIFVNDGSQDRTGAVLDELALTDPCCKVIHLRRNFGQTAAMMAGIDAAQGDILVPLDADLQNDPDDIIKLVEKLNEGYDVCSGWRRERKDKALSRILPSRIANFLIRLISGVKLNDYGCTLKAYRREVLKHVRLYGEMHRFIPIFASWQGAKVTQVPVTHHPRKNGVSKYGLRRTFKVILDLMVIKFLSKYLQEPIYIFGGFGLLSFLLSLLSFTGMVYFKYWGSKSFIQTPLPLLTILFFLIGIMSIFMGFIAHMIMMTYYEAQGRKSYTIATIRNLE